MRRSTHSTHARGRGVLRLVSSRHRENRSAESGCFIGDAAGERRLTGKRLIRPGTRCEAILALRNFARRSSR